MLAPGLPVPSKATYQESGCAPSAGLVIAKSEPTTRLWPLPEATAVTLLNLLTRTGVGSQPRLLSIWPHSQAVPSTLIAKLRLLPPAIAITLLNSLTGAGGAVLVPLPFPH